MKLLGKMGLLLGVAVAMIGVRASSARAAPANEVDTEYYADRHFSAPIGENVLLCNGGHFREGQISRFIVRFETPCHTRDRSRSRAPSTAERPPVRPTSATRTSSSAAAREIEHPGRAVP
jgi:hypothetical protein